MRIGYIGSLAVIALLALSCASANRLSKQSEQALAAGDLQGAYEKARRAVEKAPENPRARAAYTAASDRLVDDREARILSIADVDTLAAAEQVLALAELRSDLLRHGLTPHADTVFARHETAIRVGAAEFHYRAADRALSQRAPKVAWAEFRDAQRLVAGYRDTDKRIDEAFRQALVRVAILPLDDQTGIPDLPRHIADRMFAEVSKHVEPEQFVFTRLVDRADVFSRITVAELDHLTRADAIRIGRTLGADQVVTGRVYGMRSNTNTTSVHQAIFRKVVVRDTAGVRHERYDEHEFHAVERERTVTVHYDIEVVETQDEATLVRYSDEVEGYARVVFTDFQATGDCSDYVLYSPAIKRTDPNRVKRADREWKQHFGTWTLESLLEQARRDANRRNYSAADRQAFFGDCRERPVWLGGLPGDNDMATIALDVIWQPVLGMLKELDAK